MTENRDQKTDAKIERWRTLSDFCFPSSVISFLKDTASSVRPEL